MKSFKGLMIAAVLSFSTQVFAGEVKVDDAWARATVPGQEIGFVGLVITSQKDARLVAVSSPASKTAEIHTMSMNDGVMKMRQIEFLALPAAKPVTLAPGGDHLMLIGLKKPLSAGDKISVTLTVEFSDKHTEKLEIQAPVKAVSGGHHHH